MNRYLVLVIFAVVMMSCTGKSNAKKETECTASSEQQVEQTGAVQVQGVYSGTLPAASSPGIKMTLNLNEDKTFMLTSEYLEEKDGIFTEKGTYVLEDGILTTNADGGTISYFKVETNQLRMLDQDKKEITGELASCYLLTKTE